MNAKQRRIANRALNASIGKKAEFITRDGRTCAVTIIGRTAPVIELACIPTDYAFNGSKPSLHRMRCHRDSNAGDSSFGPRLAQLRIAA